MKCFMSRATFLGTIVCVVFGEGLVWLYCGYPFQFHKYIVALYLKIYASYANVGKTIMCICIYSHVRTSCILKLNKRSLLFWYDSSMKLNR